MDLMISGYGETMVDDLRYWRTRYLLVPMESMPQTSMALLNPSGEALEEEELFVAGIFANIY